MTSTVLVLTSHPTLTVSLTLQGEWDVVSDPSAVAERDQDSAIVVLDADDAKVLDDQLPGWIDPTRTVVLTSATELSAWPGTVLTRPYRLDRLMTVVRDLAAGTPAVTPPPAPPSPPEPEAPEPAPQPDLFVARTRTGTVDDVSGDEQEPAPSPREPEVWTPVAEEPRAPTPVVDDMARAEPPAPVEVLDTSEPVLDLPHAEVAPVREDAPASEPEAQPLTFDDELRGALRHADRLSDLLERVPSLGSTISLATILADDVATALAAPTAGIWQVIPDDDHGRYQFLGGVGVTRGESLAPVSERHPVVADALASGGTGVENIPSDPSRVTGLPASRHPNLVVMPQPSTPFGDLLVIVGLTDGIPDATFDVIDAAVADMLLPMEVCVHLEVLSGLLRRA